jgi:hypothetical protein
MTTKLHNVRLFMTEAGAVAAIFISIATTVFDFILPTHLHYHDLAIAISLSLIGLALFSICLGGCVIMDNHHWRMFMGSIFVLSGIGFVLPHGAFSTRFNDIITILIIVDVFLIIYDNSTIILKGSKSCKVDKKCAK